MISRKSEKLMLAIFLIVNIALYFFSDGFYTNT